MTPVLLLTALLSVADPQGDAIGQGNLTPPSAVVFRAPGIFDVQHIDVLDQTTFGFELTMGQLSNPWRLPNGFSFPIIEVYLSTHSGGQTSLLPGSNMSLPAGQRWNYAFRITGDQFNVYRATDQDIAVDIGENAAARLEVTGNTLRVQTNITMPESFSVFGMVGSYDPFTETGWREVTREPTPWAFSSREPTVPVIDVIADSFSMQRAALAQGVLPEIRSAVRHDSWLIVAAVGFVFMLIGSVGQLWWGGRRGMRRRRVAVAASGRSGQISSNANLASQSARPQKQRQAARSTSSSGQVDIGRASRGRVSNNTTRGLARQQRLGQVSTSLGEQTHNVTNPPQPTRQPDFMPASANTLTSAHQDTQHQDMQHQDTQHQDMQHQNTQHQDMQHQDTLPTAMLTPAVALGVVAPTADEQPAPSLGSSTPLTRPIEASAPSSTELMIDVARTEDVVVQAMTSEDQQLSVDDADKALYEGTYDQQTLDDANDVDTDVANTDIANTDDVNAPDPDNTDTDTYNEDVEVMGQAVPLATLNLENTRDALQDAQSDESQDMREVIAALLGQDDEDAPVTASSQASEAELPTAFDAASQEDAAFQDIEAISEAISSDDLEKLATSYPAQQLNTNNVTDDAANNINVIDDIANNINVTDDFANNVVVRVDADDVEFKTFNEAEPEYRHEIDNTANEIDNNDSNHDDINTEVSNTEVNNTELNNPKHNGIYGPDTSSSDEPRLDNHVHWTEDSSSLADQPETHSDDTPETNSLRPAELIKRERLAAKDQLELTDDFFDDAWFEWPNSGDIFTSSKDHPDEAKN